MTAAITIARGGSKRLPGKNVKLMNGHPLIAWSIIQAKCSHLVDRVYMSTDDDEIAAISESYGAEVIRRPDWPDADQVSGGRPYRHAIEIVKDRYGDEFDALVSYLPTMPCRFPDDIDRVIAEYRRRGSVNIMYTMARSRDTSLFEEVAPGDYVCTINSVDPKHLRFGGSLAVMSPERYVQLAKPIGEDHDDQVRAGADYVHTDVRRFIEARPWQAADCDTLEEFEFTELVLNHYILKGRGVQVYYDYRDE